MVRYGVQSVNDRIPRGEWNRSPMRSSVDDDDDDIDEVDNIQSKFLHSGEIRSTSYNSDELTDDEERSRECSYSDYIEDELSTIEEKKSTKKSELNGTHWSVWCSGIIIILGIYIFWSHTYNDKQNIYDESKFDSDMVNLGKKYKVNYNSILKIKSVISTTFEKEDAASLIFTYNSANSDFNLRNFNQFMNNVASATARYLRNDSENHKHVIVDSRKLNMKVHSELIERYRNDVSETGVMLVTDLDEVPSSLAMAFHYYCDEFNPLVKKSAILFTLDIAKCSDRKITHASVEKCLANKWTIIPKDNIVPLLTRIVNVVIDVTNVI